MALSNDDLARLYERRSEAELRDLLRGRRVRGRALKAVVRELVDRGESRQALGRELKQLGYTQSSFDEPGKNKGDSAESSRDAHTTQRKVDSADPVSEEVTLEQIEDLAARAARIYKGWTPLHTASELGAAPIVRSLLDRGDSPRAQDSDGDTPLHLAAQSGSSSVIRILVAAGAKPDATNRHGGTPLHRAAYHGHTDAAKLLVELGADTRIRSGLGSTASDMALALGHSEIAGFLSGSNKETPLSLTEPDGPESSPSKPRTCHFCSSASPAIPAAIIWRLRRESAGIEEPRTVSIPRCRSCKSRHDLVDQTAWFGCTGTVIGAVGALFLGLSEGFAGFLVALAVIVVGVPTAYFTLALVERLILNGRRGLLIDYAPLNELLEQGWQVCSEEEYALVLEAVRVDSLRERAVSLSDSIDRERVVEAGDWFASSSSRGRPHRPSEFDIFQIPSHSLEDWIRSIVTDPRRLACHIGPVKQLSAIMTAVSNAFKKTTGAGSVVDILNDYLSAACPNCRGGMNGEAIQLAWTLGKLPHGVVGATSEPAMARVTNGHCPNCDSQSFHYLWLGDAG